MFKLTKNQSYETCSKQANVRAEGMSPNLGPHSKAMTS